MQVLPVFDPKAAGIGVGSETLHVSIAGGTRKTFDTVTRQLHALRDWLKAQGVQSVAMEVAGVFWLCAYEILEQADLAVVGVNGKHVENLTGHRTDLKDCQRIATLHAHGLLLRSGFVPSENIRRLKGRRNGLLAKPSLAQETGGAVLAVDGTWQGLRGGGTQEI